MAYNPLQHQRQLLELRPASAITPVETGGLYAPGSLQPSDLATYPCSSTLQFSTAPTATQEPQLPDSTSIITSVTPSSSAQAAEGAKTGSWHVHPPAQSALPGSCTAAVTGPSAATKTAYLPPHLRNRQAVATAVQQLRTTAHTTVPQAPPQLPSPLQIPPHLQPNEQQQHADTPRRFQQQPLQLSGLSGLSAARIAADSSTTTQPSSFDLVASTAPRAPPGFTFGPLLIPTTAGNTTPASADQATAASLPRLPSPRIPPPGFAAACTAAEEPATRPNVAGALQGTSADSIAVQQAAAPPATPVAVAASPAPTSAAPAAWPAAVARTTVATAAVDQHDNSDQAQQPLQQQRQEQQQEQLYAPKRPKPSLSAMVERLKHMLSGDSGKCKLEYSLKEGLKWLQGYDGLAAQHLDSTMRQYLGFIREHHGPAVQACVVFFAMGHHDAFRGEFKLSLQNADFPAKVLNKRLSYYRLLFSQQPRTKADMFAALLAHRPDVAAHLSHELVERLFDRSTSADSAASAVAGLLLLPHGWEGACKPKSFVTSFATAVLQDAANAEKMVTFIEKKLAAGTATSAASAAVTNTGGEDASAGSGRYAPANKLLHGSSAAAEAGAQAASPSSSTSTPASPAESAPATAAQQQQQWSELVSKPWGTGPQAAAWMRAVQQQPAAAQLGSSPLASKDSSRASSRFPSPAVASVAAAAAVSGRAGDSTNHTAAAEADGSSGSSSNSSKVDMVELALVQLQADRPDVVGFVTRDLRNVIKALDVDAALAAVGELMLLPKGWSVGLGKGGKPQPKDHLSSVVSRAAAHAAAGANLQRDAAADDDGWVTLDHSQKNANTNAAAAADSSIATLASSSSRGGGCVLSKGMTLSAAWAKLEREKPWLTQQLLERHQKEIKVERGQQLTAQQQLQVLSILDSVSRSSVSLAADPAGTLMRIIRNAKLIVLQPVPPQLKAALEELAHHHPNIMQYMDDGIYSRIVALAAHDLERGLTAVQVLGAIQWPSDLEKRARNPSAYLMGVLNNGLKQDRH